MSNLPRVGFVGLAEGFALGLANGVELEVLWAAIKDSVADSFAARHDAPSIFAGHYDPSFSLALRLKDHGLIAELAGNVATDLPMSKAAHAAFRRAAQRYGEDAGDLQIFRGRYSLHRVTRVAAASTPRHAAIFANTAAPGVIGQVARTRQLFGRVLKEHLDAERKRVRSDTLLD